MGNWYTLTIKYKQFTQWSYETMNVNKQAGESTFWREKCIWAHGQSDVYIGHAAFTVIWPQQKSGHSYLLRFMEQYRAVVKEVSLGGTSCVNTIMSMQSYTEPSTFYTIWDAHGDALQSSIWPLHASGGSAIASHPPYGASNHIFGSSLSWVLV